MTSAPTVPVVFKRFDTTLPVPAYQTAGAAGFDLYSRLPLMIGPREVAYAPLNIALQLPPGYWAMLAARSSLHQKGLLLANGIGVGDYDYRGDGDEYKAALWNYTDSTVQIERGERIVQMLIMPQLIAQLSEVEHFSDTPDRGGYGSTGSR